MKSICFADFDFTIRGGLESVTASLVNALCERYRVHLVTYCSSGAKTAYPLDERVQYHNFGFRRDRIRTMRKNFRKPLFNYLKEHDIDIAFLQGHWVSYISAPALRPFRPKRPVFIAADHGALKNQWDDKQTIAMRFISAFLCDRVITLTDRNLDDYEKLLPFLKSKFRRIYNWIDTDAYHSDGYDAASKKILSAGRFTEEKGFGQLLDAFAPVAKIYPDWSIDIWGDGPLRGELEERARRLGIAPQVRFMGMRHDLAEHYQDYAMYVLPSYREGLPLVLLEAKACRLPIVSFDVLTGPREIVRDGVDGFLVEPRNIPALSEKILLLIDNPALRQRMSDRTQEDLERFSKETILQQWISLIEEL